MSLLEDISQVIDAGMAIGFKFAKSAIGPHGGNFIAGWFKAFGVSATDKGL